MAQAVDIEHVNTFASLPRTVRGMPLVLSAKPDNSTFLYCNGNSVYIRDVEDITKTDIYTEHAVPTNVAKYSPSGFYIASGDNAGKVRIWDTTQKEHILKAEYPVIGGPIRDIAWDAESKRIAAVGEAREKFGHVFLFDTGTSNGSLAGQSRPVSSVDFKPNRPFRLVSGSEDNTVAIFEGPPFKFKTTFHEHTRFVHCVRYNKEGTLFASGGADGKVVLFEGADGTKFAELVDPAVKSGAAHSGGVFGISWAPCGKKLATASGDKTVKIWNVLEKTLEKTISFGDNVNDQQLGVLWTGKWIIAVSLGGFVSYIDAEAGELKRVVKGHNKPITAGAVSADKKFIFTADFEGNITRWETSTGVSERIEPSPHKAQITGLGLTADGTMITVAWDDTVAYTPGVFGDVSAVKSTSTKLTSQPRGLAVSADGKVVVVAAYKNVFVLAGDALKSTIDLNEATCAAISKDSSLVAVGTVDSKVHVFGLDSAHKLSPKKQLQHAGQITSVSFSADGQHLVATDAARKVVPYKVAEDFKLASEKDWSFHTARVNSAAFSPDGRYVASAGLDTNLMVFDLKKSGEHPLLLRGAHPMSPINLVRWLDERTLLTVGQDSNLKQWKIPSI